ncbi:hypothetical protein OG21DRAFT_1512181 [Imleria badia]|nr:hypothetical protein OG21DRAFT_1512181 [Imleria badia]
MTTSELLNPAIEAHQIFDATDEDIYQAVMDAKKAREAQEASVRSRNPDGGLDSDEAVEPMTTRDEAQKAALALRKYTKYLDPSPASWR